MITVGLNVCQVPAAGEEERVVQAAAANVAVTDHNRFTERYARTAMCPRILAVQAGAIRVEVGQTKGIRAAGIPVVSIPATPAAAAFKGIVALTGWRNSWGKTLVSTAARSWARAGIKYKNKFYLV